MAIHPAINCFELLRDMTSLDLGLDAPHPYCGVEDVLA